MSISKVVKMRLDNTFTWNLVSIWLWTHMQTNADKFPSFSKLLNLNIEIVNRLAKHVGAIGAGCKCDYTSHYHIFTYVLLSYLIFNLMKMCVMSLVE